MAEEKPLTVQEAGRRGGKKTSQKHGKAHYERIGKMGGKAVAAKYGHEHFERIGAKGGGKVAELIAKAKAALAESESS